MSYLPNSRDSGVKASFVYDDPVYSPSTAEIEATQWLSSLLENSMDRDRGVRESSVVLEMEQPRVVFRQRKASRSSHHSRESSRGVANVVPRFELVVDPTLSHPALSQAARWSTGPSQSIQYPPPASYASPRRETQLSSPRQHLSSLHLQHAESQSARHQRQRQRDQVARLLAGFEELHRIQSSPDATSSRSPRMRARSAASPHAAAAAAAAGGSS